MKKMKILSLPILALLVLFGILFYQTFLLSKKETEMVHLKQNTQSFKQQNHSLVLNNKTLEEQLKEMKEKNQTLKSQNDNFKKRYPQLMSLPEEKVAYLTFDDGPSENTSKILDILKQYQATATFFVNGRETDLSKELYKRILNEGSSIGNHTYSHQYSQIYKSSGDFMNDVNHLNRLLKKEAHIQPKLMRMPGGSNNTISHQYGGLDINKAIIDRLIKEGYIIVDWNVDSSDASKVKQDKNTIVYSVLTQSQGKQVVTVLMHDTPVKTTTVEALPEIIDGLRKQGFRIEAMNEESYIHRFNLK